MCNTCRATNPGMLSTRDSQKGVNAPLVNNFTGAKKKSFDHLKANLTVDGSNFTGGSLLVVVFVSRNSSDATCCPSALIPLETNILLAKGFASWLPVKCCSKTGELTQTWFYQLQNVAQLHTRSCTSSSSAMSEARSARKSASCASPAHCCRSCAAFFNLSSCCFCLSCRLLSVLDLTWTATKALLSLQ